MVKILPVMYYVRLIMVHHRKECDLLLWESSGIYQQKLHYREADLMKTNTELSEMR